MYIPEHFREDRPEVLRAFVAKHPLGALVALTAEGISANHIPMLWHTRQGSAGTLHGHVARANPLWKNLSADAPVLAIFSGANRYITPSWYPGTRDHGKVVPTWNYSVVHAHGTIRFLDGSDQSLRHVSELADRQEALRTNPWKVSDAPVDFVNAMLTRIVSFEIALTQVVGKFKANQHRPESERLAVAAAMLQENIPAAEGAELIRAPTL